MPHSAHTYIKEVKILLNGLLIVSTTDAESDALCYCLAMVKQLQVALHYFSAFYAGTSPACSNWTPLYLMEFSAQH